MVTGGRVSELAKSCVNKGQWATVAKGGRLCRRRKEKQQRGPTYLPLKPEPLLPQLQGKRNPLGGSVLIQVPVES